MNKMEWTSSMSFIPLVCPQNHLIGLMQNVENAKAKKGVQKPTKSPICSMRRSPRQPLINYCIQFINIDHAFKGLDENYILYHVLSHFILYIV